ncbi:MULTISPECIES: cytidylyltransferase domain-containing protein [Enterobacter cloacae complex]|uniref:acylneuraminate cytidylyltransferase family protein n=1 Tax=Enterobacter cloacae complex TaxID=354276 RepID=UPI000665DF82|nr:acylneuraminate cytidylyltransferase family protein [Enterobacter kobei]MCK7250140.1 acylneuraminate cytidylyltransferase family protein [Enterobacter kobei]HDC4521352.1 acylneuraminate cytidylyltransferase family protein [Enterobacter kobei]
MKKIAIIPARGGSKRLPGKNIKKICGRPLIEWTIEAALKSKLFDRIIVSTDSDEIREISIRAGAEVPYLRSPELSSDTATTNDVVTDIVNWLEGTGVVVSTIMILQPTSPLRTETDIINAFDLMVEKKAKAIVSVCEIEHPIQYCNVLEDDLSMDNFIPEASIKRTQDLPTYYRLNGSIYLFNRDYVSNINTIYSKGTFAYIMNRFNSIDIDEEIDFELAEILLSKRIN